MAITTYSELLNAATNWLGRSDLSARMPEFLALAEADMKRKIRPATEEISTTMVLGSDSKTISSSFEKLRSVRYSTSTLKYPLRITTPENLAELRQTGSGIPRYAAMLGSDTLLFDIQADDSYDIRLIVEPTFTAIATGTPSTSALLTSSPDIYLYGMLKEAELYLEHDQRNPIWAQKYNQAIYDENLRREEKELGAAPKVPNLPIVFG